MKFRTEIQPLGMQGRISHENRIFLIGSCFTDAIGSRLRGDLFNILANPFGTVYNPESIAAQIEWISSQKELNGDDLICNNGIYHSFLAHSSLSSASKTTTLHRLNTALSNAVEFVKNADFAIITLGSALVYRLKDNGKTVANCHKLPSDCFVRSMLSLQEVTDALEKIRSLLQELSPSINIIFTVSPIRYVSDGLHENQLSKATLLLGINEMCNRHESDCLYFPSYEIVIDDLRDYRFFEPDMKHPSLVAADYVYEIFCQSFFSPITSEIALKGRKLTRRFNHRPLTDDKEAIETFKTATNNLASQLSEIYPELIPAIKSYKNFQL